MPLTSRQVLLWGNRPLPVVDLAAWVRGRPARGGGVVGVVAYAAEGSVAHGALLLDAIPRQVRVDDDQALAPSELPTRWAALCHSAYRDDDGPVPVLDLARIFTRVWPLASGAN
jgi:chemotaxis signal transduction protein